MTRDDLERRQLWLYLAAIAAGLGIGVAAPGAAPVFEALLWPALAALLLVTFTQVPLVDLPAAFADRRFMAATLTGNFVALPLLVWALLALTPDDPAVRLGVAMVLLVPCTDWFITFTHLAGGDTRRAVAVTPVNLLLQLALTPLWLWAMLGSEAAAGPAPGPVLTAFALLIAAPLALAWRLEIWAKAAPRRIAAVARLGALPVPLLALVVFTIAAAQAEAALATLPGLGPVAGVFLLFAAGATALGSTASRMLRLPRRQGVTLIFGLVTRNSFVVLPFALALPPQWAAASIVIVAQSLVELAVVLILVRLAGRLAGAR